MSDIQTESYGLDESLFPNYSFRLGRAPWDRVQKLWSELSKEERELHKDNFNKFAHNMGKAFEIESQTPERIAQATKEHDEGLQYIDRIFFLKYGEHVVLYPQMMGLAEFPIYD